MPFPEPWFFTRECGGYKFKWSVPVEVKKHAMWTDTRDMWLGGRWVERLEKEATIYELVPVDE